VPAAICKAPVSEGFAGAGVSCRDRLAQSCRLVVELAAWAAIWAISFSCSAISFGRRYSIVTKFIVVKSREGASLRRAHAHFLQQPGQVGRSSALLARDGAYRFDGHAGRVGEYGDDSLTYCSSDPEPIATSWE